MKKGKFRDGSHKDNKKVEGNQEEDRMMTRDNKDKQGKQGQQR